MEKEVLIFQISGQKYGVPVSDLQGIENYTPVTAVANAPDFIEGIIRIRDEAYPVLDLKMKFSMAATEITLDTKQLVLNSNAGKVVCAVDSVVEISTVQGKDIQPCPLIVRSKNTLYVDCVIRNKEDLIVVIDVNQLFDKSECSEVMEFGKEQGKAPLI